MGALLDGLSGTASAFAIISGTAVGARYGIKRWRRRPAQQQRDQAAKLDRLALRRPIETIESALGKPQLKIRQPAGGHEWVDELVYRLPGAWVTVQAPSGVIETYSVTVTDAALYYDTDAATSGIVKIRFPHPQTIRRG